MTAPQGDELLQRPGFLRTDSDLVGPDLPPLPTLRPLWSFRRLDEPAPLPGRSAERTIAPTGWNGHPPSAEPAAPAPQDPVEAEPPSDAIEDEPAAVAGAPELRTAVTAVDGGAGRTVEMTRPAPTDPADPLVQAEADAAVAEFGPGFVPDLAIPDPTADDAAPADVTAAGVTRAEPTTDDAAPADFTGDDHEAAPEGPAAARTPSEPVPKDWPEAMVPDPTEPPGQSRRRRLRDDPDRTTEIPAEQMAHLATVAPGAAMRPRTGRHTASSAEPTEPMSPRNQTVARGQDGPVDADRSRPRRVLVVGAGAAGAAVAAALAGTGLQIAVSDASGSGTDVVATLPGGRHHVFVAGDYTDPVGVNRILQDVMDGLGGLDVIVYTAAAPVQVAADGSAQEWADAYGSLLTVNLLGAATVAQGASRLFRSLGVRGRIVLVATAGTGHSTGMDRSVAQGLIGLGTGLAEELAGQGVEVTVVSELRRESAGGEAVAVPESSPLAGTVSWLVTRPSETPAPVHIALSG